MSAMRNAESLANQGEFRSRIPPAEPLMTTGHKPGVKFGKDAVPEFHMEKQAAGTAPRENSFQPRPERSTPVWQFWSSPNKANRGSSFTETCLATIKDVLAWRALGASIGNSPTQRRGYPISAPWRRKVLDILLRQSVSRPARTRWRLRGRCLGVSMNTLNLEATEELRDQGSSICS
ncbi:hypothetical protein F5B19DRAFT_493489 [Rostrohypoxylon terebratum]|nr:hypothetical protein F5B19DRAFT_493489 [Rostrohypoxylon terebratum]